MKTKSPHWLSPRECEVLLHRAKGKSFKWIGYELNISEGACRSAAKSAYRKLGVHDTYAAVERHPWHKPTPSRMCYLKPTFSHPTEH